MEVPRELRCPKGHVSTDPDYCSECGTKLAGAPSAISPSTAIPAETLAAAAGGAPCPVCSTPRVVGARFCEVCRYDFETAAAPATGTPVAATPALPAGDVAPHPSPVAPSAPTALPAEPVPQRWDAVIAVDPSLYKIPDPAQPCPVQAPERIFPLDMEENLVGRRSDRKDIHPEIMILDPGISRRHLSFRRRDAGDFAALDLGSTNGTALNATPLEPGIPTPLKDGDQITLGCWTRITIRAR
jgi:FHA domain-containing protein